MLKDDNAAGKLSYGLLVSRRAAYCFGISIFK